MVTAIEDDFYEYPASAPLWKAYPNPFTESITLEVAQETAQPFRVSWYDLQGRLMKTTEIRQVQGGNIQLSTAGLVEGIYVLRMEGAGQSQSFLLRKE